MTMPGAQPQGRGGEAGAASAAGAPGAPAAAAQTPQGAQGGRQGGRGPATGSGGAAASADRANWDAPYIISPHAPRRLYWASQYVYRTDDRGDNWTRISPDLSRNLESRRAADHGQGVAG